MKNFEKYEEKIKELDYTFTVNKYTKEIMKCGYNCPECLFNTNCDNGYEELYPSIIKWLYEEYNPKTQLTIKEINELLKDKYPNGIEVIK